MKKIIIESLTETGDIALKEAADLRKLTRMQRIQFKVAGYSIEVLSKERPVIIALNYKGGLANDNHAFMDMITAEIIKTLKNNGAEPQKDFKLSDVKDV